MRLPTITSRAAQLEAGRAFHERLWTAFQWGHRLTMPTDDPKALQHVISSNFKRFWSERGYAMHTHCGEQSMDVWLTTAAERQRRTSADIARSLHDGTLDARITALNKALRHMRKRAQA